MENGTSRNRVVVLTGPGRSAIGTIRLEGPRTAAFLAGRLFSRSGAPFAVVPESRPRLARFKLAEETFEEVVIYLPDQEHAEIHCHGNPFLIEEIIKLCVASGFHRINWQDWIRLEERNPIAAAARVALASALTWTTASHLLDQYGGALTRALEHLRVEITAKNWPSAQRRLDDLLRWGEVGRHLIKPWKVVLLGPPNAGKSSILNWVLGYERVIVDPTPGTTRDFVSAVTSLEGWPVEIFDTAGVRKAEDALEQEAVARSLKTAREADLVLLAFDRSLPWDHQSQTLLEEWPAALVVHNKRDLPPGPGAWPEGLLISTRYAEDRDVFTRAILARLIPEIPPPGTPLPFLEEHIRLLQQAQEAVRKQDATRALSCIQTLLRSTDAA